jgi:outer membrane protein TolC
MLAAIETWRSYQAQLSNARRQYDDTFRRYKEGVSNYIEVLDARTQVTNVELQQSLSMYTVLLKQAELERAVAGYELRGN